MKKRLVLTTVHDNQQSVQIDLYKSFTRTMADALYIGSLVMENVKPQLKGEPSIELILASSKNGDITADAVDLDASVKGEHQTLNVSLKSMEEDKGEYELPDFELGDDEPDQAGLYREDTDVDDVDDKKKFPWLIIVCAALILTAAALVIWIFFFQNGGSLESITGRIRGIISGQKTELAAAAPETPAPVVPRRTEAEVTAPAAPVRQPSAPPQNAQPAPAQPAAAPQQPAAATPATPASAVVTPVLAAAPVQQPPPPVIKAPAEAPPASSVAPSRDSRAAPVASYNVPSVIPREGVSYRIRYGDTLWDIADAFYRNPWQYPRIARFNNIRNPDLIISGTTIRVPPKN